MTKPITGPTEPKVRLTLSYDEWHTLVHALANDQERIEKRLIEEDDHATRLILKGHRSAVIAAREKLESRFT
jgi:hypothetical protein